MSSQMYTDYSHRQYMFSVNNKLFFCCHCIVKQEYIQYTNTYTLHIIILLCLAGVAMLAPHFTSANNEQSIICMKLSDTYPPKTCEPINPA